MSIGRQAGYIESLLLESSPGNVGGRKFFDGIAGSLLAAAAQLSRDRGAEGYLKLTGKTELIPHYRGAYGFVRHRNSQIMISDEVNSARRIAKFAGGRDGPGDRTE